MQYDFNKEAAKISALSSGKIDKYEYLTSKEVLPFDQSRIIEQTKFTYFPLGKALEKQAKGIEDQGEKQIRATDLENTVYTQIKNPSSKIHRSKIHRFQSIFSLKKTYAN